MSGRTYSQESHLNEGRCPRRRSEVQSVAVKETLSFTSRNLSSHLRQEGVDSSQLAICENAGRRNQPAWQHGASATEAIKSNGKVAVLWGMGFTRQGRPAKPSPSSFRVATLPPTTASQLRAKRHVSDPTTTISNDLTAYLTDFYANGPCVATESDSITEQGS